MPKGIQFINQGNTSYNSIWFSCSSRILYLLNLNSKNSDYFQPLSLPCFNPFCLYQHFAVTEKFSLLFVHYLNSSKQRKAQRLIQETSLSFLSCLPTHTGLSFSILSTVSASQTWLPDMESSWGERKGWAWDITFRNLHIWCIREKRAGGCIWICHFSCE